ncbi:MAG: hypothetical protein ACYC7L_06345 [Nitrospirota bacterium]
MSFSHKTTSHTILRGFFLVLAISLFFQEAVLSASSAATPSPSSPRLVGTVEGGPFSGAVFDDGTGVQAFYRLHEKLPDGSTIVKVRSDSIVIKKDDGLHYEMYTTGTANSAATALPSPDLSPARPRTSSNRGPGSPPIRPRGRLGRTPQPSE